MTDCLVDLHEIPSARMRKG